MEVLRDMNGYRASRLSFYTTTYNMVDDPSSDSIISWSQSGKSFIIWNPEVFHRDLLQKYFHDNLDFFFEKLDIHGFRKIDSGTWEFANDYFVRGQPHLMERDPLYERSDVRHAMRLFRVQVKDVNQHTGVEVFGIDEPYYRVYLKSLTLFLTKAYEIVDDPSSDEIISWSESGKSFIIRNPQEFYKYLLPRLFKKDHVYLFFTQLMKYGFRKVVGSEKWEFANENFVRGQPQLVENITKNHIDQLSKNSDRREKMKNAEKMFKLQIGIGFDEHKRPSPSNSLPSKRKKTTNATQVTQVKELEVQLQHVGISKM